MTKAPNNPEEMHVKIHQPRMRLTEAGEALFEIHQRGMCALVVPKTVPNADGDMTGAVVVNPRTRLCCCL